MPSIFSVIKPPKKTGLFYKNPINGNLEFLLTLDATISDTHSSESSPTEHAVEDGSVISDHVDVKPRQISIEGIVSDTPITLESALLGNASGLVSNLTSNSLGKAVITGAMAGIGGMLIAQGSNRAKNAYDALLEAQRNKVLFSIVTGLTSYENMILTSLSVTRNSSVGRSLKFTGSFREVRIVDSETVQIPKDVINKSVAHTASETQKLGKKAMQATSAKVSEKATTVLFKLKEVVGL